MQIIDKNNWPRFDRFDFFRKSDFPYFSTSFELNVTKLIKFTNKEKISFFNSFLFLFMRAVNQVDSFKYRYVNKNIVKFSVLSPSFTILSENKLFNFCTVNYNTNFIKFNKIVEKEKNKVEKLPHLNLQEENRQDVIYCTCLPWLHFTSFNFNVDSLQNDFIPRVAWGKFKITGKNILLPFAIQVNHAMIDGLHIGELFQILEAELQNSKKRLC